MNVYFFDTETTGTMPGDRLCQLAIKADGVDEPYLNEYYNPGKKIPPEASAVHHISNKMVADKPPFIESPRYAEIKELFESPDTWVVAHNAAFDVGMLEKEGIHPTNVICTLKLMRAIDGGKDFSNHKLQYLRYALEMDLDVPAHDALADVRVLEPLFHYALDRLIKEKSVTKDEALLEMKRISDAPMAPMLLRVFNFGKHRGKTVEEVTAASPDYLQWLLNEKLKNPTGEEDWIYTLKYYLKK